MGYIMAQGSLKTLICSFRHSKSKQTAQGTMKAARCNTVQGTATLEGSLRSGAATRCCASTRLYATALFRLTMSQVRGRCSLLFSAHTCSLAWATHWCPRANIADCTQGPNDPAIDVVCEQPGSLVLWSIGALSNTLLLFRLSLSNATLAHLFRECMGCMLQEIGT